MQYQTWTGLDFYSSFERIESDGIAQRQKKESNMIGLKRKKIYEMILNVILLYS